MELWDIKASALRLMFADTDIQFNKEDFTSGVIYDNFNTRDKLIRMNDSVRRAIDLYYQYCGQYGRRKEVDLLIENGYLTNVVDISNIEDFGTPSRVDVKVIYRGIEKVINNVHYYFDNISKELFIEKTIVDNSPYRLPKESFKVLVFYEVEKNNLPEEVDELTFNLDTLNIPQDVQRMIPKYIKGEIYEEDEYSMANVSKNEYLQFLVSYSKKFSNVQTRVKSIFRRS